MHRLRASVVLAVIVLASTFGRAVSWLPFGPDGGDARSFAADPQDHLHLYLGTTNGWIYESANGGKLWRRLARVARRDDLVLDHIIVDPTNSKHLLVGAWVLGRPDGGLFVSTDRGATWKSQNDMEGQSIRAMASAPSDAKILVAGTLKGVYRSTDGGEHWKLISPEGSQEIHEVESIAIDPKDPQIIYAGTWHLPWKTTDGGEHWNNIKDGVIEDSDVFSIIVDPVQPATVYVSACSGIYKSDNGGEKFVKVQGIPSSARRTRVLKQDPLHLDTVFAGTTEGLFRTGDSGKIWIRTTGPELIVNDVHIDPTDASTMLVATDRGGVLISHDGGTTFESSNSGFSARQITSYVADIINPNVVYVGMVNDKQWGGVFVSDNGGLSWSQRSGGLGGRDVLSLGETSDGTVVAGTGHGLYRLDGETWNRVTDVSLDASAPVKAHTAKAPARARGKAGPVAAKRVGGRVVTAKAKAGAGQTPEKAEEPAGFDGSVYGIARGNDVVYAVTSAGVLRSGTAGQSWMKLTGLDDEEWRMISVAKQRIVTASLKGMMLSSDGGERWTHVSPPPAISQIGAVAVDGLGNLWAGGREGVFVSRDSGATWETLKDLYVRDVNSVFYDAASDRVLITANSSTTFVFSVHLPDMAVKFWDTGWNLRFVRPVADHLVGATLFDGIVIQPQMIESKEVAGATGR